MSSILSFATQGERSLDQARLSALLAPIDDQVVRFPFEPRRKASSALRLFRTIQRDRPALVVMEGTGIAGGAPLLLARTLLKTRYVVVSGDAVGPYIAGKRRGFGPMAWLYEVLLLRHCAAFIGWTPYLAGRALTFGAPRVATAPGWAPSALQIGGRQRIRAKLGIAEEAIVFGIVGSLNWTPGVGYAYGAELVRAMGRVSRTDIVVLVVGDGSGLSHLKEMAGDQLGERVKLVGRVAREEIPCYLDAFDVASLPQSCDQVGAFRYSTKLPEYLAAGLPIVTGQLPLAYDLAQRWSWRLPGSAPWSDQYVCALAQLMSTITSDDIAQRKPQRDPVATDMFALEPQQQRVKSLLTDLLASC